MKIINKYIEKNFFIFSLIFLINIIWYFLGLRKVPNNLLNLDQEILALTASRMKYFNLNTFEATWNHHTSPINYIFKLGYLFSDFQNIEYGIYIIYSLLLLLINFVLYKVIYKFTKNFSISYLLSVCFIFDLSTATISDYILFDNRTIGILFQCLILYYGIKIIDKEIRSDILLFSLFIFLQIAFLESYFISCVLVFIYFLFKVQNKIQFCKIFFLSNLGFSILFFTTLYFNSELLETIYLNYQFHFDAVGINSIQKMSMNNLLNYGLFKSWSLNKASYLFILGLITIFYFKKELFLKNKTQENYYNFLSFYFISEVAHVFLTGPRFVNYLQLIILFKYLIIFVSIFFIVKTIEVSEKKLFVIISSLLIVLFLIIQFDYFKNNRSYLLSSSYSSALTNGTPESEISKYLFNAGTPETMLAWVSTNSWDDIYFNSNKLPATRMWWWFNMKYQEDTYRWENGKYYNNNLDKIFFEDLLDESPRLAVIQEDIDSPPLFIKNYVESNYTLNKKIDGFLVYITNSKLEQ